MPWKTRRATHADSEDPGRPDRGQGKGTRALVDEEEFGWQGDEEGDVEMHGNMDRRAMHRESCVPSVLDGVLPLETPLRSVLCICHLTHLSSLNFCHLVWELIINFISYLFTLKFLGTLFMYIKITFIIGEFTPNIT